MKLVLEDGTTFTGKSFGEAVPAFGEVVFTTGMVGYVESLSDPSYAGQILVFTSPLIGNYGVPERSFFESGGVQAAGVVVSEYSEQYSHHTARQSLGEWLKGAGVPAITGIDTRALTKKLRTHGVMLGAIVGDNERPKKFIDLNSINLAENLVARVSIKKAETHGNGPLRIIAVDCGVKENILRSLVRPETTVVRVPWNYDFTKEKYDGIVFSNGPGNPTACISTIKHIKKAFTLNKKLPMLGICLGTQLMALAAGAKTYKLKFGHRSQNQPCLLTANHGKPKFSMSGLSEDLKILASRDLQLPCSGEERCYITSQNHGFAVEEKSLPKDWSVWFKNANDGSVEGIKHATFPWQAVQFHPEAHPGPTDTGWIFDDFLRTVRDYRKLRKND